MLPNFEEMLKECGGMISLSDAQTLYRTAMNIEAKNILEIGGNKGCSSMVLATVAQQTGGHLQSIEPAPLKQWKHNIDRHGLSDYATQMYEGSPWVSPSKVKKPIDFLFLDGGGNHHTIWMIADFQYWQPFVRPGGYIAFHDWTGARGVGQQVQRAVRIILEEYPLLEVAISASNNRGVAVFEKPLNWKNKWWEPSCL